MKKSFLTIILSALLAIGGGQVTRAGKGPTFAKIKTETLHMAVSNNHEGVVKQLLLWRLRRY